MFAAQYPGEKLDLVLLILYALTVTIIWQEYSPWSDIVQIVRERIRWQGL